MSSESCRAERTTTGTWDTSRRRAEHLDAVQVWQAEVEDDEVGGAFGEDLQRGTAVRGGLDLVVAGPQVDGEGPPDVRLVVDDEDEGHGADPPTVGGQHGRDHREVHDHGQPAARGVLGEQGAVHRLGEPAGDGQPEPDAVATRDVAAALERREDLVLGLVRDARPAVDHPDLDPVVQASGLDDHLPAAGRVAQGVLQDVGENPVQQAGVGPNEREAVVEPHPDPLGPGEGVARCLHDLR